MMFTIRDVCEYFSTGKAVAELREILTAAKRIFNFTNERENRLRRCQELTRRYENGERVADIAERYGCSRGTVLRYARAAGMPLRSKGFPENIRKACIEMYSLGKPIAEISAALGVSQAYVSKTATEEGINRKTHRRRMK